MKKIILLSIALSICICVSSCETLWEKHNSNTSVESKEIVYENGLEEMMLHCPYIGFDDKDKNMVEFAFDAERGSIYDYRIDDTVEDIYFYYVTANDKGKISEQLISKVENISKEAFFCYFLDVKKQQAHIGILENDGQGSTGSFGVDVALSGGDDYQIQQQSNFTRIEKGKMIPIELYYQDGISTFEQLEKEFGEVYEELDTTMLTIDELYENMGEIAKKNMKPCAIAVKFK